MSCGAPPTAFLGPNRMEAADAASRSARYFRFKFGHCKPASAGSCQGPCTSPAGDRTATAGGPSGTRAACQAARLRRRIGARERCLSSTDVGNPGKADSHSYSDRPTRPRRTGTGRARRTRARAPGGCSGRSCPLFTSGGRRSRREANQGWPRSLSLRLFGREAMPTAPASVAAARFSRHSDIRTLTVYGGPRQDLGGKMGRLVAATRNGPMPRLGLSGLADVRRDLGGACSAVSAALSEDRSGLRQVGDRRGI